MTTYCSNPRCDNRCGRKPPTGLGPGTYSWADFCSPTRVPVADEDEADPDEPTDAELVEMPDLPPLPPESDPPGGSD